MNIFLSAVSFVTGMIAGLVDSIAGGGGLITVPVIMAFNLPPVQVLGTNRLQGGIGELTATLRFLSTKQFSLKELWIGLLFTIIGAIFGTLFDEHINAHFLAYLMPFLLLFLIVFFVFHRPAPKGDTPKLSPPVFFIFAGLCIGFYNGFFGPSTGTLWTLALIYFLAFELKPAIMRAKPLNFIGNFTSMLLFVKAGDIVYSISIPMGLGQICGALIGSQFVLRKDVKFIRPVFITIVVIMTAHVFYKTFWPSPSL